MYKSVCEPCPPLTALRAFEADARHLSFTKAAEELHVTPAAISNQIKSLESFYNVQLFLRLTRALVLTEAGQPVQPSLRQGFDKLAEAAERLETFDRSGVLTVGVTPFFCVQVAGAAARRFLSGASGNRCPDCCIDAPCRPHP